MRPAMAMRIPIPLIVPAALPMTALMRTPTMTASAIIIPTIPAGNPFPYGKAITAATEGTAGKPVEMPDENRIQTPEGAADPEQIGGPFHFKNQFSAPESHSLNEIPWPNAP